MGKITQADKILFHLLDGNTITSMGALRKFKVMRLAGRIFELREKGWDIRTEIISKDDKQFARYIMGDMI